MRGRISRRRPEPAVVAVAAVVVVEDSFLLKKTGALVNVGDPIAIVGNSGSLSTGPHLHFELWYNGVPVDPEKFIIFE